MAKQRQIDKYVYVLVYIAGLHISHWKPVSASKNQSTAIRNSTEVRRHMTQLLQRRTFFNSTPRAPNRKSFELTLG